MKGVLQIRQFRNLWLGQAVSQLGDALYMITFLYYVQVVTRSSEWVGVVAALQAVPFLFLGPIAGVVADRADRRAIMLLCDNGSAILLVAVGAVSMSGAKVPLWLLLVAPFLLSSVNAFFLPAKSAAIPRLVPPESLLEANSLSQTTSSLMPLIGLGFGGVALGVIYARFPHAFFGWSCWLNAATFWVSALAIRTLPHIRPDRVSEAGRKMLHDAQDGLKFVWHSRLIRNVFLQTVAMHVFIAPFMVVEVAANQRWFGGRVGVFAWLEFAFMAGMVISSLQVGRMVIRRPGVAWAVGLGFVGGCVALMSISLNVWVFSLWNLLAGLALPFATIPIQTHLVLITPDEFRGRVSSAFTIGQSVVTPASQAVSGVLIGSIGLPAMFVAMGVGMAAPPLLALFDSSFRELRAASQSTSEEAQPESGTPVKAV